MNTVADRHRHPAYLTSTCDRLFGFMNIDDLE